MKTIVLTLLSLSTVLACVTARADDPQPAPKKSELTQSQRALDHGPRAQVTPAVKRARLEAAKTASAQDHAR